MSSLALARGLTIDFSPSTDESVKDMEGIPPIESEGELQVGPVLKWHLTDISRGWKFTFSFPSFLSFFCCAPSTLHLQEERDDGYDQCSVIYKLKDFLVEKM